MELSQSQVDQALENARSAFPQLANWQHVKEEDEDHFGFSMWGEHTTGGDVFDRRHFFVTLDTWEDQWSGHLTIGQHAYMWSSADCGDATLVSTKRCPTLAEAITSLKSEIARLFATFT